MDKIGTALEPALQKLSEIFCVSVDAIRENGMEYILMYGKYAWIQDLISTLLWSGVLGGFVVVALAALGVSSAEDLVEVPNRDTLFGEAFKKARRDAARPLQKKIIKGAIVLYIVQLIVMIVANSLPYWVCPEMYSIHAVVNLVSQ